MDHPKDGKNHEREQETERVRELLARTVRFLTHCTQDPKAALDAEDPRDLIRALEVLAAGSTAQPGAPAQPGVPQPGMTAPPAKAPQPEGEQEAPPSIHIRRRRSA